MDKRTMILYLLSRMRSEECVRAVLASSNASDADMKAAFLVADEAGLEQVHSAQLYRDALGAPIGSDLDDSVDSSGPFAGSRLLRFALTPWPEFDFAVREHPQGYAWGRHFVRRRGTSAPQLTSRADLHAWKFVQSELTLAFGTPRSEDAWSGWEDLSYSIPESHGGATRRYLLRFDMELLQTVDSFD